MRRERDDGFEYRIMERTPDSSHEPSRDWHVHETRSSNGRAYRSLGAARGVLRRVRDYEAWLSKHSQRQPHPMSEFKIQRRPVSASWEDVES